MSGLRHHDSPSAQHFLSFARWQTYVIAKLPGQRPSHRKYCRGVAPPLPTSRPLSSPPRQAGTPRPPLRHAAPPSPYRGRQAQRRQCDSARGTNAGALPLSGGTVAAGRPLTSRSLFARAPPFVPLFLLPLHERATFSSPARAAPCCQFPSASWLRYGVHDPRKGHQESQHPQDDGRNRC